MLLGIEIGGTKLQFGVSSGEAGQLAELVRLPVDVERGATGILEQIAQTGRQLIRQHAVRQIGIGFGGPVDVLRGRTTKSHQISGWDDFPLIEWCQRELGCPAVLGNDCDVATLAEARYGAGLGRESVFYVTVGTGVGGGFVVRQQIFGRGRPAIAEIGHLRPGIDADDPHATVESVASGWGIAATARKLIESVSTAQSADAQRLRDACQDELTRLTAVMIADAARLGNAIACHALDRAVQTLGWAIAQVITLLAPEVIVVGGGVSQMGDRLFFQPLRASVAKYVFPPLADHYAIVPASLAESVVVHGAIALVAGAAEAGRS